jgi:hypothetical protein
MGPNLKKLVESKSFKQAEITNMRKEFMQDLYDIIAISKYVKSKGVKKFTLSVNW